MDSIKSQLLDMGFSELKVEKAITSCPEAKTVEQIMEWLIAHEDELNVEQNATVANAGSKQDSTQQPKVSTEIATTQDSGQTTDGESRIGETVLEEAARKKLTVEEVQKLIAERLLKRAEEERKKAIEDEKKRREMGQKILETRQELQDQERIRLAQQIRQEKLEKELHRKRVLEQIARDREAMKNKNSTVAAAETAPKSTTSNSSVTPKAPSSECKLALRFPDGTSKVQKFSPQEQLSAVRLFVGMNGSYDVAKVGCVEFVAPPNRKLTDSQMHETLESLGLCPASRLEVKFNQSPTYLNVD